MFPWAAPPSFGLPSGSTKPAASDASQPPAVPTASELSQPPPPPPTSAFASELSHPVPGVSTAFSAWAISSPTFSSFHSDAPVGAPHD